MIDAVILAGGQASEAMAARTGTPLRALFDYQGKPFVQWVYEALRASEQIARIAIIGPPELAQIPGLAGADLILPERESITANLFSAVEELKPSDPVLITACDNPLLTTAAFDDFLSRAPQEAAVAFPYLPHAVFQKQFPGAQNIPISLRDGVWIGGDCILIQSEALPALRQAVESVLAARKSKARMLRLLGPGFALRFALKRLNVRDIERRISEITHLPFRFVPDCSPVFVIDIDDPEDWIYLEQWSSSQQTADH